MNAVPVHSAAPLGSAACADVAKADVAPRPFPHNFPAPGGREREEPTMPLLRRLVLPPSFTCDTPKPVFSAEFMCPSQPPTPHVHCPCSLAVRDAGGTAKCVPQVSSTRTPAVSAGDEARRGRWHRQLSEVARTAHTTRFPGVGAMVDWMHFGCSESKEINADFLEALRRHMPHIRHDAPPPSPLLLQEACRH